MRSDGLTLIELLMAMAIITCISAAGYDVARALSLKLANIPDRSNADGGVRMALNLLAQDLRCAYLSAGNDNLSFVGRPDAGFWRLDFVRTGTGSGEPPAGIGYRVKRGFSGEWQWWRTLCG